MPEDALVLLTWPELPISVQEMRPRFLINY